MRHTEGIRQSVIMTRKLDYAAFCQGAIMTFDSKLRHYDVRHNGVRQSGMRQNTIPPKNQASFMNYLANLFQIETSQTTRH